jgi:hypothetical protein
MDAISPKGTSAKESTVPAPRIDHLLGNDTNRRKDSQDFEELLRRALALSTPAKPAQQSQPREVSPLRQTELLTAKAS